MNDVSLYNAASGRESAPDRPGEATFDLAERFEYIRRHGRGCLTNASLQPGMRYLDLPGIGYVAYRRIGWPFPTTFIQGDPICDFGRRREVLDAILSRFWQPVFVQLRRRWAMELHKRGFYVNEMGREFEIPLHDWKPTGSTREPIRRALNACRKSGVEIRDISQAVASRPDRLLEIHREWLKSRPVGSGEIRFLVMPHDCPHLPDTRAFAAFRETEMVAFGLYTPLYEQGHLIGFMSEGVKSMPGSPRGMAFAINAKAASHFRRDGLKILSLGLAPCYGVTDGTLNNGRPINNSFVSVAMNTLFHFGNGFYRFKGMTQHKRKYGADELPVYFCTRRNLPVVQIYWLIRACDIHPLTETLRSFFRIGRRQLQCEPVLPKVETVLDSNGQRHEESELETAVRENPSDGGNP